ncbi:putative siderophore transport system ATP-binding protein YusV [Allorhodopirellula heiligendammensis]|uniref:Siderophore transport system ATP-binding protein YusV n=1 Tax=Allorhodopirellula heiligendammensis TaxID=2714739 RepID=A0A5C6BTF3_9BACT|nr:ABC transporter ATP-binding protein [Allorhodopirellula heiligendammensis]TWU15295.1 putative siderophore transport system ATP-binding protein YusV [Allorhodopirellula heiligendammensis]
MTILRAENLTFGFDTERDVIRELSLELRPGELMVLLGGNGAGKTTLLRILAGHLCPGGGRVWLDGRPVDEWSTRDRAQRLALMPQAERCESAISVRELVRLGRAAHRGWLMPLNEADEHIVDEALAVTQMTPFQEQAITTLSGGQWRRAILARSLTQGASALLLDEPTSGLDLRHQYECLDHIRRLVREKQLIAIVTLHDLNQAAMFADRISLLADQRVFASGSVAEVLTRERIKQTYGIDVSIMQHPVYATPVIVPVLPGDVAC